MQKIFLSNLILVIGLNVLVKPLYLFGIDRGFQNAVGAADYGLYFALFNFVYLFQIFNDFGIQNFNHSVFSKYQGLIPKYLPKILGTKVLLATVFALLCLLGTLLTGFGEYLWPLLLLIMVNQILASLLLYLRTTLSALGHYRLDSILSVSDKLLMIAMVGYRLWFKDGNNLTVTDFISYQMLSFLLSTAVALLFLYRYCRMRLSVIIDWTFSLVLFRKSVPYALVLFLMTMYTRMDGVMLERLLPDGPEQAGIYGASYRILDAFGAVGLIFAGLLLPMFARLIRNQGRVDELIRVARDVLLTFSITMIAISITFHQPIIFALYDEATVYWASVYQVLFVSFLGVAAGYIYGTLLTSNESIGEMNRIFLGGVVLNLGLNLVFIAKWQAWGAALATLITQWLTSFALIVLAYRRLGLQKDIGGWGKLTGFSIAIFMITGWIHSLNLPLVTSISMVCGHALVIAWILGLMHLQTWIAMTRSSPDR
jgi:O-antigen/teichoic acid export membrane protein